MNTRRRSIAPPQNVYAINARICKLVKLHPCLYDRHDDNYLRKSTVKNAWKEISNELRITVESCKERWHNIRSSYARSIKLHHGENTYYLNSELMFLQRHITPGVSVPLGGRRSRPRAQKEHDEADVKTPLEAILEMVHSPSCLDSEHAQSRHSTDSASATEVKTSTRSIEAWPIMDFDDAFLHGLRPEIKHMNFRQKLYFKRRVYDLLGEVFHSEESASPTNPAQPHPRENVNGTLSTTSCPSPANPLQHLGLMLQLPKRVANASQDL
ncbi:uncharacterized protein LOC117139550 isoform X2 [Drosophila mauritiana]|uniref:Uncharacterized protein LOC117139550 isoform X2 n=1 Tax=Drosophila mauritiana TaxID=7226 RepID=A0A6P8JPD2_DROMA|nr:uncharacterized protein LOC117139550 isoform X2 [Drosophila mauritiana]